MIFRILALPFLLPIYFFKKFTGRKKLHWVSLEISGDYSEAPPESGWINFIKSEKTRFYELSIYLHGFLRYLKNSSKLVKEVKVLTVYINQPKLGWAQSWEIRDLLSQISATGVNTRAYLLSQEKNALYIATGCSEICAPPAATFDLSGFHSESFFLAGFFEKIGVKPQFLSVGKFKSAAEMFERKNHSTAARTQLSEIFKDFHTEFLDKVMKNSAGKKNLKQFLISAQEAKKNNIIQKVIYPDQFTNMISESLNGKQKTALAFWQALSILSKRHYRLLKKQKKLKIAVMLANGPIVESYETTPGTINLHDLQSPLEELKTEKPDAVILRINSPGGSALTSDLIWQLLMTLQDSGPVRNTDNAIDEIQSKEISKSGKKKKKEPEKIPVLVSQSDVAASGGYYISAIGNNIYSTPLSITGSIGVVAGKFNISGILKNLGISLDSVNSGDNGEWLSLFNSFTVRQKNELLNSMQEVYNLFLDRISQGRNMITKEIHKLGQGRVYSGKKAKELGLIDKCGGLTHAIQEILDSKTNAHKLTIEYSFYPRIKTPLFRKTMAKIPFLGKLQVIQKLNQNIIKLVDDRFL